MKATQQFNSVLNYYRVVNQKMVDQARNYNVDYRCLVDPPKFKPTPCSSEEIQPESKVPDEDPVQTLTTR